MSKEGSSGGSVNQDPSGNQDAPNGEGTPPIAEKKSQKKIVRLITVLAYMVSVSSGAMALSGYYLFLWKPPNPRLMHLPQRFQGDPQVYMMNDDPNNISNSFVNSRMIDMEVESEEKKMLTSNESMNNAISNLKNSLMKGFRNHQSALNSQVVPSEPTKVNNLRLKKDLRYKESSLMGMINRRINENMSLRKNNISHWSNESGEGMLNEVTKEETSFDKMERNSTEENLNLTFIDDGSDHNEQPPSNRSNSTILGEGISNSVFTIL